jgi:uncharacterized DUF497 family protein
MKFEWDPNKESINIKKHGVTFEQAAYVFADQFSLSMFDDEHSDQEERWVILGKSNNEMILLVIHTFRNSEDEETVRIISARKATKHEEKTYKQRCKL